MKITILLAAVFATNCSIAIAQDLVLRSGDHATFSRITLPIPAAQTWRATTTKVGVEVYLPDFVGSFDTSGVFMRMRNDRISKILGIGNTLLLSVECVCVATAFRSGELLVIDVADIGSVLAGPPIGGAPMESVKAIAVEKDPAIISESSPLPWLGDGSPFAAFQSSPNRIQKEVTSDPKPAKLDSVQDERTLLLNGVRQTLVEEVANAASAGILKNSLYRPSTTQNIIFDSNPVTSDDPSGNLEGTSKNVRITNSMNLVRQSNQNLVGVTAVGVSCPPSSSFAIEEWGNESSFSVQVGGARNALVDARDELNQSSVNNLVQTFIYFGFGAEALNTLELDQSLKADYPHLANIATILDHDRIDYPNTLSKLTDCDSNAALWASLSFSEIPHDAIVNIEAALRALDKLPAHLRQLIAPRISKRFLEYGNAKAATSAMRSIERVSDTLAPEAAIVKADLAIKSGEPATQLLESVIKTNTLNSPAALIKLVESKLAKNDPLSPDIITLLAAYAHELRETEVGSKLQEIRVISLSKATQFSESFALLDEISPSISLEKFGELKSAVVKRLSEEASDTVFLEYVISKNSKFFEYLPIGTKLLMSSRLLNLGFAMQAQELLLSIPESRRSRERQILVARAAILLQQPYQAQAALIGLDGTQAELIGAQAKEMAGEYRAASEIFASNEAPTLAAMAAWLSNDWRNSPALNNSSFSAVAALDQSSEVPADSGPLGEALKALNESGKARNTLDQLLNEPILQVAIEQY